jgi:ribulose kinase
MQIHADVSNIPMSFTRVSEGPVLGSAILGAVGAGIYPDITTATEHMVHIERTLEPDPDRHEDTSSTSSTWTGSSRPIRA